MNTQLFEVQFHVRPTRLHPQFGVIGFGFLCIWLYETDEQNAFKKGHLLAENLPYEFVSGKSFKIAEGAELLPYQVSSVAVAEIIGINFGLSHWPVGENEEKAIGHWPAIIPPLH